MTRFNAGVWAGIFFALFSLLFLIQSGEYSYASHLGPGPGFFPAWACGSLLVLSLIYIYQSFTTGSEGKCLPKMQALKNILKIIICMAAFILLVKPLGFVVTSTLFLLSLLWGQYKWYSSLGISAGVSVFLFWLFGSALSVPLPVNGFGW